MAQWINSDGLVIQLGITEASLGKAGSYEDFAEGAIVTEFVVNFGDIPLTTPTVVDQYVTIPAGYILAECEVIAETAVTSGGAATIDMGTYRLDRVTPISSTAIIAGLAITALNATGKRVLIQNGSTGAGTTFNGVASTFPGVFTFNCNVAALTAGKLRIKLRAYRA